MPHYTFSPIADSIISPKEWYQQVLLEQGFVRDATQASAIERLDVLWHALVDFKSKRNRFLGRTLRSPEVPRGLYFWGGVGRGKSFLMDTFFTCVPYVRKRRVHFHRFMADVHKELSRLHSEPDPLNIVAANIAKTTRLLCFDEFHVSDIADAMILSRLLEALFARGVIMVMTSNYPPDKLYPNGLQRVRFLPAIEMLNAHLEVINIDGGQDYRLRQLVNEPLFIVPADSHSDERLSAMFDRLSIGCDALPTQLTVLNRTMYARRRANGIIWFDFKAICGGPRAQTDYLELARDYHTIFVSSIPKLLAKDASEARRFTWLVDVFYDHRIKLIISAAVALEQLYTDGLQASEFFRTVSRLTEMQSTTYLELSHLVDQFQLVPSHSVVL